MKDSILHQAKIQASQFLLKRDELWSERRKIYAKNEDKLREDLEPHLEISMDEIKNVSDPEERKQIKLLTEQMEEIDDQEKRFYKKIAGYPDFIDILEFWNIDVVGGASCFGDVKIDGWEAPDFTDILSKVHESQKSGEHHGYREREEVREFFREHGFDTHSSGGGMSGWDLGYSMNTKEADRFCKLAWSEYEVELNTGIIQVLRKPSNLPSIPGITNWNTAKKFMEDLNG